MSKFVAAVILVCLAGCGAPAPQTAETTGTSAGGDAGAGAGAGQGDPNCGVSAKGVVVCPDPRTRLAEWDTYAVHEDGKTLDLHFVGPGADCAKVDDVSSSVMPTEVHVTLRLLDLKRGCDQAHRTAAVTLSEPLAGRPVYSEISVAGGGVSSRGYTGAVEGPECLGPDPAHVRRSTGARNPPTSPRRRYRQPLTRTFAAAEMCHGPQRPSATTNATSSCSGCRPNARALAVSPSSNDARQSCSRCAS
jgi:hypothetical protein